MDHNNIRFSPPAVAEDAAAPAHRLHRGKVACQVCHAQAIKQCFGCHVGTDAEGIAYFKCRKTVLDFKIGRNPAPTPERPYTFTVKHHPPIVPETFDYYSPGALQAFDQIPTWKDAAPIPYAASRTKTGPATLATVVLLLVGSPALAGFAYEANKPHLGGDVTPLEAFEMVKKDPEHTFLVDCRTRAEYQFVGHPEGACNEAIKAGWAEDKVFNMMGGFEGGKNKNKDSLFYGQRWDGGWQREGLPWTYSMDTALMYKPDVDKMTSNLGGGRLRVAS